MSEHKSNDRVVRRPKLELANSVRDVIVTMSEGNPGALSVLIRLMKDPCMGLMLILDLDDMGMWGSQIWVAWKHCKCDMPTFLKALQERDPAMVEAVNQSMGLAPGTPQAVTYGASRR